ncbi:PorP/SprF family type IX secretion system membrane protein [Marinigracilibium pacificum]|uniref:Type IX secretion system membrane protein PorP/SprF n=1 Tax=Marinigracilibium pacificum TaxID=2729599 RepID=A0A848IVD5_9BACT|nr:type IX secretion system membrane protein PorP/SprF [Marinigracilibium pacificum]NMM47148.1 type IX secretion system membrane protein PorP/SprF [Marinigracilibium pacificum]
MKLRYFFTCISSFLLLANVSLAQQDVPLSQFMFNKVYYNPAYSGVEGLTKFTALHRTQWAGYNTTFDGNGGNPVTQMLTMNTALLKMSSGVGFYVVNDRLGPQSNLEIQGSFAYHLRVGDSKLSFGVRAGAFSQTIDFDQYRAVNPDDPLLGSGKETQIRPDLSIGAWFQHEDFYIGVSSAHITEAEFDFNVESLRNPIKTHLYLMGGYDYDLNYDFTVTPSILVRTDLVQYSFDLAVLGTYKEKMYAGLSYRQEEAIIAMLGYSFLKENAMKVGYAFDYIVSEQSAKQATSHEIMLSYTLPVLPPAAKKVIRTPRFRH